MENLIKIHESHIERRVTTEVQAAWLHHAFTQIHPFQDGNGRVARAIASFVFIKNGYFPLVIVREDRVAYIDALEKADCGDLKPLIELFAKSQRRSFIQAIGVSHNVISDKQNLGDILQATLGRLAKRENSDSEERVLQASKISKELEDITFDSFSESASTINDSLKKLNKKYMSRAYRSNEQEKKYFYGHIVDVAKEADYFADLRAYDKVVYLRITEGTDVKIAVAFHGIGRLQSGTFGAMPFFTYRLGDRDQKAVKLSEEPFIFSYAHDRNKTVDNYRTWFAFALTLGISEWNRRIN